MPKGKGTYGNKVGRPTKMVRGKTIPTKTGQYFKPVRGGAVNVVKRSVQAAWNIGSLFIPGTKTLRAARSLHRTYNAAARGAGGGGKKALSSAKTAFTNLFGGKVQ